MPPMCRIRKIHYRIQERAAITLWRSDQSLQCLKEGQQLFYRLIWVRGDRSFEPYPELLVAVREISLDEVIFGGEMAVQSHLRHARLRYDCIDANSAEAFPEE